MDKNIIFSNPATTDSKSSSKINALFDGQPIFENLVNSNVEQAVAWYFPSAEYRTSYNITFSPAKILLG